MKAHEAGLDLHRRIVDEVGEEGVRRRAWLFDIESGNQRMKDQRLRQPFGRLTQQAAEAFCDPPHDMPPGETHMKLRLRRHAAANAKVVH